MDINGTVRCMEDRIGRLTQSIDDIKREIAELPRLTDRKIREAQLETLFRVAQLLLSLVMVAGLIKAFE